MHLAMPTTGGNSAGGYRRRLGYFVLASLLLHLLVVGLWHAEPPAGPVGQSTFTITLLARQGNSASKPATGRAVPGHDSDHMAASRVSSPAASEPTVVEREQQRQLVKTEQPMATIRRVSQGKNSRAKPIEAGPGLKTVGEKPHGSEASSRDGQEPPGVPGLDTTAVPGQISASNGSRRHGQHELTVAAKYRRVLAALYEALFPHFDYPSVARRRGWQGRVKVGLHVEADGDLSRIHLVESSGYALLDKAAVRNVTELRSVPGASQWLEGSDIDVVLPVSYQLNDY